MISKFFGHDRWQNLAEEGGKAARRTGRLGLSCLLAEDYQQGLILVKMTDEPPWPQQGQVSSQGDT
jgi:hypothetical protein